MGLNVVHVEKDQKQYWGVLVGDKVRLLKEQYQTTAEFLENGQAAARKLVDDTSAEEVSVEEVKFLSPVTRPARVVCQGANYGTHREESGLEGQRPDFNTIFGKADSSITGPYDNIVRPQGEKTLDYEIELALVLGKGFNQPVDVAEDQITDYVAGIVISNDVSARAQQMTEGQWLKGKSYRTFLPLGPVLYLIDQEEIEQIHNLDIKLWVNDEIRQEANTSQLLFKPGETLSEISKMWDMDAGDILLTGTTGGVAMQLTKDALKQVTDITLPGNHKLDIYYKNQLVDGNIYLNDGDVIKATIKSPDGKIDLGQQINTVVSE